MGFSDKENQILKLNDRIDDLEKSFPKRINTFCLLEDLNKNVKSLIQEVHNLKAPPDVTFTATTEDMPCFSGDMLSEEFSTLRKPLEDALEYLKNNPSEAEDRTDEMIATLKTPLEQMREELESHRKTISACSAETKDELRDLKTPLADIARVQTETTQELKKMIGEKVGGLQDPLVAIVEEQQKMNSAIVTVLAESFGKLNSTLDAMTEVQQVANSEEMKSLQEENAEQIALLRERDKELSDISNQLQNATHRAERLEDELKQVREVSEGEKEHMEKLLDEKLKQAKQAQEASKNQLIAEYEAKLREMQTNAQSESDTLKQQLEALRTQTEKDKAALEQEHEQQLKERDALASAAEERMKKRLKDLEEENDTAQGVVGDFAEQTKIYLRLMRAVYQCPSMQPYLSDNGLPEMLDESARSVITFIAATGSEYRFARDLVNYMVKFKKNDRVPITEQEMELIDQTNAFYFERYQEKYGLTEGDKVLVIPEGMEALGNLNVVFRKADMRDIDKVLGTFRNATALYAPAFREYNSNGYSIKATVAGK